MVDGADGSGDGIGGIDDAIAGAIVLAGDIDDVDVVGDVDEEEPHPTRTTVPINASVTPSNRAEPVIRRVLMTRLYERRRPLPCRA